MTHYISSFKSFFNTGPIPSIQKHGYYHDYIRARFVAEHNTALLT